MKGSVIGRPNGMGLLDLIVTLVIFALFVALAVPAYTGMVNRGRVAGAIGDVGSIAVAIERFAVNNNDRLPATLNELNIDIPKDPWGNDYEYELRDGKPYAHCYGRDGQPGGEGDDTDYSYPEEEEGF